MTNVKVKNGLSFVKKRQRYNSEGFRPDSLFDSLVR